MILFFNFILLQISAGSGAIDHIIESLAKQGPLVSLCILACYYFYRENKNKDKELKSLNEYIRENDKENIQILNDVNNTLDRVLENQKHSNEMVIKEIESLKEYIIIRLK